MDPTLQAAQPSELAPAFLQACITIGLAVLFVYLHSRYRKPYLACWGLAWALYALRMGAIITLLLTTNFIWLYWHQVATGWTALTFLWAALVFSQRVRWRREYILLILFPPVWSYLAIYQLDRFLLAAAPAVLFLSLATFWTGWAFFRHYRRVGSTAAVFCAVTLFLWSLHHLDYPFLRAQGTWNPWGYYLDTIFALAVGLGILMLMLEDLRSGLRTLSTLSGDLHRYGRGHNAIEQLLERPLNLPGVRGTALFVRDERGGMFSNATGICAPWAGAKPTEALARIINRTIAVRQPEILHGRDKLASAGLETLEYVAALPIFQGAAVSKAMVIVGDARDPFAALDAEFLAALGQQVGAAIDNADLYRSVAARTAELERLATRMVQQHEQERNRLSRELHDETAQVFSAVKLRLGMLREAVAGSTADQLDEALKLVDTGIQSIRNVTRDLRPSLLDDLGFVPALRALVSEFEEHSGVTVRFEVPDALPSLSDQAELALYRALQEGLSNVARHAEATAVTTRLTVEPSELSMEVVDDGRGVDADYDAEIWERNGHVGLPGMRHRVAELGGSVSLASGVGRGTRLVVSLPIEGGDGESA